MNNIETIGTICVLLAVAIIIGLVIWRRRQIMAALAMVIVGLRQIISPRWNNRVFLVLCAITIMLFFNAVYQGGGEPLGTRALKKAFAPSAPSGIVAQYQDASRYLIGETQKPGNQPTWRWWKIWFMSLLVTLTFIPFAFWDEVRDAWRHAMERFEQRQVVIDLRPAPQQPSQTGHVHAPSESGWQRFRERVFAGASANALYEFAEGLVRRILTERIMRRVR